MTVGVMLDLETLGTGTLPPIIQIAAVAFDTTTFEEISVFNEFISLKECEKIGAKAEASTLTWWNEQSSEAKKMVLERSAESDLSVKEVLTQFSDWYSTNKCEEIWGNGSTFDNRILEASFLAIGLSKPWKYNADRDLRTAVGIATTLTTFDKGAVVFKGVVHNAVDDCRFQVEILRQATKALQGDDK